MITGSAGPTTHFAFPKRTLPIGRKGLRPRNSTSPPELAACSRWRRLPLPRNLKSASRRGESHVPIDVSPGVSALRWAPICQHSHGGHARNHKPHRRPKYVRSLRFNLYVAASGSGLRIRTSYLRYRGTHGRVTPCPRDQFDFMERGTSTSGRGMADTLNALHSAVARRRSLKARSSR